MSAATDGDQGCGLLRDPRLYGMALMAPAILIIVVMHPLTTGRIPLYLSGYFLPTEGALFTPICMSLDYDLLYIAAFIVSLLDEIPSSPSISAPYRNSPRWDRVLAYQRRLYRHSVQGRWRYCG